MSRQYTYQSALPSPHPSAKPIHSSAHLTSSAFSANANADEDWTQISDLAERRRIQNRIAQRNYRKKLKKRLEDLERRAGSSSASPPPSSSYTNLKSSKPTTPSSSYKSSPSQQQQRKSQPPTLQYTPLHTPPMDSDDLFTPFSSCNVSESGRDGSHTPPLYYPYAYASEAEAQPYYLSSYPAYTTASSQPVPALYRDDYAYMASNTGMTLPSMSQFDAMSLALPGSQTKREDLDINVSANPFSMSYAAMAGLDMPQGAGAGQAYEDPTTPPLCHSYEHSAPASECGANGWVPGTPGTLPPSPAFSGY